MSHKVVTDWKEMAVYSNDGPKPQILEENGRYKVIIAGLEAGQKIPVHPEGSSVFHILEGRGWMTVEDERCPIQAGSTIVMDDGSPRGFEADTKLTFLAVRMS